MAHLVGGGAQRGAMRAQQEQLSVMRQQQAEQRAQLDEEKARTAATEDGQRRLRKGQRGLLAYIEDEPAFGRRVSLG